MSAAAPDGASDGIDQHELRDAVGELVGEADGDAAAERMPDHDRRRVDVRLGQEVVHPSGKAGDRPVLPGQVGRAAEAGHRGGEDPVAAGGQSSQPPLVGAMAQSPAVQKDDRRSFAYVLARLEDVLAILPTARV